MTFVNVMRHPHQLIPGLKYRDKQPLTLIPKVNLGQLEARTMVWVLTTAAPCRAGLVQLSGLNSRHAVHYSSSSFNKQWWLQVVHPHHLFGAERSTHILLACTSSCRHPWTHDWPCWGGCSVKWAALFAEMAILCYYLSLTQGLIMHSGVLNNLH